MKPKSQLTCSINSKCASNYSLDAIATLYAPLTGCVPPMIGDLPPNANFHSFQTNPESPITDITEPLSVRFLSLSDSSDLYLFRLFKPADSIVYMRGLVCSGVLYAARYDSYIPPSTLVTPSSISFETFYGYSTEINCQLGVCYLEDNSEFFKVFTQAKSHIKRIQESEFKVEVSFLGSLIAVFSYEPYPHAPHQTPINSMGNLLALVYTSSRFSYLWPKL